MESISAKRVWTSKGWVHNARVYVQDGVIHHISQDAGEDCDVPVLIPGMIDLHVHGFNGFDVNITNHKQAAAWLELEAAHGVTALLATVSSAPMGDIRASVGLFDELTEKPVESGSKVLGVHLEGPFISIKRKGGMNEETICPPSIENYKKMTDGHEKAIKLISLAPEIEGAAELICYLRDRNVCINAGHSDATAAEMQRAVSLGVDGVTHFFNAARPIHHRDPGMLTAALLDKDVYCEMISDMEHLAPEIIHLLIQTAGAHRIAVITDSISFTGMPDGEYGETVVIHGAPKKRKDGTPNGGCCLMDDCVRKLISIGVDPWDVFCMTSYTPARRIRMNRLGDIAPLHMADMVAMDETYHVLFTVVNGRKI